MALVPFVVDELSEPLKIQDEVIVYAESQMGPMRNTRYGKRYDRVKLGLQTSPENFFYNAGQWEGATYVNLNALEFTMTTGDAETGVYDAVPVGMVELFAVEELDGTDTIGKLKLKVNQDLIEQVEIREGDDYLGTGTPVEQIHLSLKSTNKPDFSLYEWHPQPKYRFNRQCNVITDTADDTMAAAYMGDNNYVLSTALFAVAKAAVLTLA
jgi:hypothetical protein